LEWLAFEKGFFRGIKTNGEIEWALPGRKPVRFLLRYGGFALNIEINKTIGIRLANLITSGDSLLQSRRSLSYSIASACYCTVTLIGILREIVPEVAVTRTVLALGWVTGVEGPLEHPVKMPRDATVTIMIAQSN
jgi:hypothetical protein